MTANSIHEEKRRAILDKFNSAQAVRQQGNDAFKAGDIQGALRAYYTALLSIKGLDQQVTSVFPMPAMPIGEPSPEDEKQKGKEKESSVDEPMPKKVKNTLALLYCNMAACHAKRENWQRALECAKNALALDETNKKAAFREAQARIGLGELQAGKKMLMELHKKAPDAAVTALLKQLEMDDKARTKKSNAEFKGFLSSKPNPKVSPQMTGTTGTNGSVPSSSRFTELPDETVQASSSNKGKSAAA